MSNLRIKLAVDKELAEYEKHHECLNEEERALVRLIIASMINSAAVRKQEQKYWLQIARAN